MKSKSQIRKQTKSNYESNINPRDKEKILQIDRAVNADHTELYEKVMNLPRAVRYILQFAIIGVTAIFLLYMGGAVV